MKIEEAILAGIEYEKKVSNVYKKAAEAASDKVGKKMFQMLAQEELYHLFYLNKRLDELKETGKITAASLSTKIPSKTKISEEIKKLDEHINQKGSEKELQLLQKALKVEKETSAFYVKMMETMTGVEQEMFKRFVEIEEGHVAIVQAEIDVVSGMGFWFDMQEFQMEGEI